MKRSPAPKSTFTVSLFGSPTCSGQSHQARVRGRALQRQQNLPFRDRDAPSRMRGALLPFSIDSIDRPLLSSTWASPASMGVTNVLRSYRIHAIQISCRVRISASSFDTFCPNGFLYITHGTFIPSLLFSSAVELCAIRQVGMDWRNIPIPCAS